MTRLACCLGTEMLRKQGSDVPKEPRELAETCRGISHSTPLSIAVSKCSEGPGRLDERGGRFDDGLVAMRRALGTRNACPRRRPCEFQMLRRIAHKRPWVWQVCSSASERRRRQRKSIAQVSRGKIITNSRGEMVPSRTGSPSKSLRALPVQRESVSGRGSGPPQRTRHL